MKWEKVKLKDCCIKIGSGATPKGGSTVYLDSGITFIRSQNVYNLHFDYDGIAYITDDAAEKLNGVTIYENDILLNITGDSVARTCMVPKEVLPARVNQHVAIVRVNQNLMDSRFLSYYLASPQMQAHMLNLAVGKGASRNAITKIMIENFEVPCPPIETQCRIADILSAYDDLIENNQKQIKLLEEAAQRLYKEWFVDLRFPGHEQTKIIESVPEGWRKERLENFIEIEIGGGWGEETSTGKFTKPAYVIRGTDLFGITHGSFKNLPYRFHVESNLSSRKLQDGDIIFEVSGGSKTEGVARACLITRSFLKQFSEPVMCASFCKMIRPKKMLSQYLYDTFKFMRDSGKTLEYDKKSASSIVNYRWKDFLKQEFVFFPNQNILNLYNDLACSMYKNIQVKSISIENAKLLRNRLLQKLMSGEIEV